MMGRVVKISLGTALLAVAAAACITSSVLALFLQTFSALTRETPVAQVVMVPIQSDDNGEYMDIEFTPYRFESSLAHVFNLQDTGSAGAPGETQTFKIYGDTVAVRGPLIKLHPGLLILNFENIYKLSLIEGEYRRASNAGREGTEITINGGFDDSWWNVNNQEANFPYNLIVDRFTFSGDEEPGFYGEGRKRYEIVVTMDAITWNYIEDVAG